MARLGIEEDSNLNTSSPILMFHTCFLNMLHSITECLKCILKIGLFAVTFMITVKAVVKPLFVKPSSLMSSFNVSQTF